MTAATTPLLCACGHPSRLHTEAFGCDVNACGCDQFRAGAIPAGQPVARPQTQLPAPAVVRPIVTAAPAQPVALANDPRVLFAAAKRSSSKSVVALGAKVEADLAKLLELLRGERESAEAARLREARAAETKAEIARLEAQLAAAKAKLVGRPAVACSVTDCDRSFESSQAMAMHRRRTHEGFDPHAPKAG
jgi:hypothetical protein